MTKILTGALVVFGLALPLSAAPITGKLNFTGSVRLTADTVDWTPLGTGEGVILTVGPGTDYFADIFNPGVFPPYHADSADLVGQSLPLPNFLTGFEESPEIPSTYDDLSFTLTQMVAPTAPACTGSEGPNQACSVGLFTLFQTAGGNVDVTFDVRGFFVNLTYGDDGSQNTSGGIYTAQLPQTTTQQIVNTFGAGSGIDASYSATYTATAIPEPATLLTFGAGTLLIGALRRRRAKKSHA